MPERVRLDTRLSLSNLTRPFGCSDDSPSTGRGARFSVEVRRAAGALNFTGGLQMLREWRSMQKRTLRGNEMFAIGKSGMVMPARGGFADGHHAAGHRAACAGAGLRSHNSSEPVLTKSCLPNVNARILLPAFAGDGACCNASARSVV